MALSLIVHDQVSDSLGNDDIPDEGAYYEIFGEHDDDPIDFTMEDSSVQWDVASVTQPFGRSYREGDLNANSFASFLEISYAHVLIHCKREFEARDLEYGIPRQ